MLYTHRPFCLIAVCFGLGILAGTAVPWHPLIVIGMGACLWIGACFLRGHRLEPAGIGLVLVCLGAVGALNARYLPGDHVAFLQRREIKDGVVLDGVIVSDVDRRTTARGVKDVFTLEVRRVKGRRGWQEGSGKVLAQIFRRTDLRYGDRIEISGKLHQAFEPSAHSHFSYRRYLRQNGIYRVLSVRKDVAVYVTASHQANRMKELSLSVRRRLQAILDRHLNALDAGMVQALVLGGRYHIPDNIRELFVRTGTAHILAISGMNIVSILSLIILSLGLLRFRRSWQMIMSIVLIVAYGFLVGSGPSVVRSVVMVVILMLGLTVEREGDTYNSLGLAAVVILSVDPYAIFDIGFQLSFAGVFSILYFYPPVDAVAQKFLGDDAWRPLVVTRQAIGVSLAAWLGVAGLVAYHFEILTPVTVLANLLIIPLVTALMALGLGILIAAFLAPWLLACFAVCISVVIWSMINLVYGLSRIPGAYFYIRDVTAWHVAGYYIFIFVIFFLFQRALQKSRLGIEQYASGLV